MNRHFRDSGSTAAPSLIQGETTPLRRILVVDDDSRIRQLSTEVLIRSGYQVDAAEDGVAAWETLQIKAFNLMITDYSMPRLTGLELVKKLRSARIALPVILATGTLLAAELDRNPDLRLSALLLKPFSPLDLVETVESVMCPPWKNRVDRPIGRVSHWPSLARSRRC